MVYKNVDKKLNSFVKTPPLLTDYYIINITKLQVFLLSTSTAKYLPNSN